MKKTEEVIWSTVNEYGNKLSLKKKKKERKPLFEVQNLHSLHLAHSTPGNQVFR
jgi:hypothetical protein